jgi:Transcriptional Coactivator p15 (PC4)
MQNEILIGTIGKREGEEVRVYLGEFHGSRVDVRIWFKSEEGEYCATKKGVMLPVGKLPDLVELLQQAYARAVDGKMLD